MTIRQWLADLVDAYALDLAISLADWLRGGRVDRVAPPEPDTECATTADARTPHDPNMFRPTCAKCGSRCEVKAYGDEHTTDVVRFDCPIHGGHTVRFDLAMDDDDVGAWLAVFKPHAGGEAS